MRAAGIGARGTEAGTWPEGGNEPPEGSPWKEGMWCRSGVGLGLLEVVGREQGMRGGEKAGDGVANVGMPLEMKCSADGRAVGNGEVLAPGVE
ncbi:hypothetical protein FKM82_004132 [Ascaphus truei]